jgi:hypothetical protein
MLWSTDIDLIARAGIDLIGSEPVQNQLVSLQINKEESKHNSVTAIIPRVFKYSEKVSNTPLFVIYFSNTPLGQKKSQIPRFFFVEKISNAPVGRVISYDPAPSYASSLPTRFPLTRSPRVTRDPVTRVVHLLPAAVKTLSRHLSTIRI